jgi:hypothetical protein
MHSRKKSADWRLRRHEANVCAHGPYWWLWPANSDKASMDVSRLGKIHWSWALFDVYSIDTVKRHLWPLPTTRTQAHCLLAPRTDMENPDIWRRLWKPGAILSPFRQDTDAWLLSAGSLERARCPRAQRRYGTGQNFSFEKPQLILQVLRVPTVLRSTGKVGGR